MVEQWCRVVVCLTVVTIVGWQARVEGSRDDRARILVYLVRVAMVQMVCLCFIMVRILKSTLVVWLLQAEAEAVAEPAERRAPERVQKGLGGKSVDYWVDAAIHVA